MTKYYRVRTPEQWDWLNNKLKEHHKGHSTCPYDELLTRHGHVTDATCAVVVNNSGLIEWGHYQELGIIHCVSTSDFIEVSDLMEDGKMENEDYVTIKGEDLEEIKNDKGFPIAREAFDYNKNYRGYSISGAGYIQSLSFPKSLLYPKVRMSVAEKKEFDELKKEVDHASEALSTVRITDFGESNLARKIYRKHELSELDFARAWADPSLIEVIPEKRWNVKVAPFERTKRYYCKDDKGLLGEGDSYSNQYEFQQFTADELKEYGLDDDMFEKVEVKG